MFELADPPDYEPVPAASVASRAYREGRDPVDLAYDLLLADNGRAFLYLPVLNYDDGTSTRRARCSRTRTQCPVSVTAART